MTNQSPTPPGPGTEALRLASWLDCTRGDVWPSSVPQEAAAELRRLHAALSAAAPAVAPAMDEKLTQPWYDLAWKHGATSNASYAGDELTSLEFTPAQFDAFCAELTAPTTEQPSEVAQAGAPAARTPELERMTSHRAVFFMERFLREEKMLGPNEQAALHFVIAALEDKPQAGAESYPPSSEHFDELRATLEGLHAICENVSAQERRIGPLGSHARGYTHKITAALRHLDALAAALRARGAVPSDDSVEAVARVLCRIDGEDADKVLEVAGGKPTHFAWMRRTGDARAILAAAPQPPAALPGEQDADPLQGAANWLVQAHVALETSTLAGKLSIGYNRAERLHAAAISAKGRAEGGAA